MHATVVADSSTAVGRRGITFLSLLLVVVDIGLPIVLAGTGLVLTAAGVFVSVTYPGPVAFLAAFAAIAVSGVLLVALLREIQARVERPTGHALTEDAAPGLWAMVRMVADELGVVAPGEIRVVWRAVLTLTEQPRSYRFRGHAERRLYIGMAVLASASREELRQLLVRELGIHAIGTRAVVREMLRNLVGFPSWREEIPMDGPSGMLLRMYRKVVRNPICRRLGERVDLMGDAMAARRVGPETVRQSILAMVVREIAWNRFYELVLRGGVIGLGPSGICGPFADFLADGSREILAGIGPGMADFGLHHATWRDLEPRLKALPGGDAALRLGADTSARDLLADFDGIAAIVDADLSALRPLQHLNWPDLIERIALHEQRLEAVSAYRDLRRCSDSGTANLSFIVEEVEAGRGTRLFNRLHWGEHPHNGLAAMIHMAMADAGGLTSRYDARTGDFTWEPTGTSADPASLAAILTTVPGSGEALRTALAAAGIDIESVSAIEDEGDPAEPVVWSGIGAVRLNGVDGDLVITDRGLLFMPGITEGGARARIRERLSDHKIDDLRRLAGYRWLGLGEVRRWSIVPVSRWWRAVVDRYADRREPPYRFWVHTVRHTHRIEWTHRTESLFDAVDHTARLFHNGLDGGARPMARLNRVRRRNRDDHRGV
ncbi:hypothetical protein LX16_3060 [Stackebrandtia albiflava]|uniref:Uncharacterized protein n=1 Tax=Stackebrandtia albiflava TaxID=406432 RepID=A0A562V349_9ACTN|nr:hypothetical protein [Stackebrandtia albiflava]TWJ12304.1 hypothetical protein LX16_3060 [Stackebrandtia albiflava]